MKKYLFIFVLLFTLLIPINKIVANQDFIVYNYTDNQDVKSFSNFNEANQYRRSLGRDKNYGVKQNDKLLVVNYGVVEIPNWNVKGNGYTNGAYGKDSAFIGKIGNQFHSLLSGNVFTFNEEGVTLQPYTEKLNLSHYKNVDGELVHYISMDLKGSYTHPILLDRSPSYLKEGVIYYSYDGHYFYTDYKLMINDLIAEKTENAVNKTPYYNYYQFLPYRTQTNYGNEIFKDYFYNVMEYHLPYTSRFGRDLISRFNGTENAFNDSQDLYGANALLTYGIGRNESADGYSQIAQDKFNLFGHSAFDSSPYSSATGYNSNSASIYEHANTWMSSGYLNPNDWRYYGTHLGDKQSGINVRYASDPYWSEKAISNYYKFDKRYGFKDHNAYTIGISLNRSVDIYNQPNGNILYSLKKIEERPFVILGEEQNFYKVQSESSFTFVDGRYDFYRDVAYIPKETIQHLIGKPLQKEVKIIPPIENTNIKNEIPYKEIEKELQTVLNSNLNNENIFTDIKTITLPNEIKGYKVESVSKTLKTGDTFKIGEKTYSVVIKGDVNKDGKVTVRDIGMVLNHIEKTKLVEDKYSLLAMQTRDRVTVRVIADILRMIER